MSERNQEQEQEVEQETETPLSQLESPLTTPTTAPAAPIDDGASVYLAALRDSNQRAAQLQERLDRLIAEQNAPPPKSPEEQSRDFFAAPEDRIDAVVKRRLEEALRSTVAPLIAEQKQQKKVSDYQQIVNGLRNDPQRRFTLFDKVNQAVWELLANFEEVSVQQVAAAYFQAVGLYIANGGSVAVETPNLSNSNTNNINNNNEPNRPSPVSTPPHLRSSAPAAPGTTTKPKLRELTENEETLRRRNGQTKEQYLAWLDVPASEVVSAKVGRE